MYQSPKQTFYKLVWPILDELGIAEPDLGLFFTAMLHTEFPNSETGYGPFHISHDEHWSVWDNYLCNSPDKASQIRGLASQRRFLENPDQELECNMAYSIAIAAQITCRQLSRLNLAHHPDSYADIWLADQPRQLKTRIINLFSEIKEQFAAEAAA